MSPARLNLETIDRSTVQYIDLNDLGNGEGGVIRKVIVIRASIARANDGVRSFDVHGVSMWKLVVV